MAGIFDVDRRTLLTGALALGGLAASSKVGDAQQSKFSGKTVTVGLSGGGSWLDSVDKLVGGRIRAFGGKVVFIVDAPQGNIAKLFAARGGPAPFDVLESGPNLVQLAAPVVTALDYTKIPNAKVLPSYTRHEHYVWNCASEDCIVYNTKIFKANGIPVPQHYEDLVNPKLKGKVAMPDIDHVQHWDAVVGMAYDGGGNESDLAAAIPIIKKIHPRYFYQTSTDLAQKMGAGEIWAAPWHAGWAVRLRKAGLPMGAAYCYFGPKKRGALWPVILQLTKGAREPIFGLKFIDLYLDPKVQSLHAKATGVLPVNPWAITTLAEDPIVRDIMLLDKQDIDNLFIIDFAKINQAKWQRLWNEKIIG